MIETRSWLVPDYYPDFHCKIGACRHSCCDGWPVDISMADYFHLAGVSCSSKLRRKLDASLDILPSPTEEAYARICPGYTGDCGVRLADGRCGIQAELGEDALACICRLYPRGPRIEGETAECSCSNSCEAVTELFLDREAPLHFIYQTLTFDLPKQKEHSLVFETLGRGQKIRLFWIRLVQNRKYPLSLRLVMLGLHMREMEKALEEKDEAVVTRLLSEMPELSTELAREVVHSDLDFGLKIAEAMLDALDERSDSVRSYGESALAYFHAGQNLHDRYLKARDAFENLLPQWEHVFEHLLVNHMFFEQFPFQDRDVSLYDEFVGICSVYVMLRFLSIGWLAEHPSRTDFADVSSALFRLIEHTEFDRYAAAVLHRMNCAHPHELYDLLKL